MAGATAAASDAEGPDVVASGDDTETTTATGAEITGTETYIAGSKARNAIGRFLSWVLGLCTVLITGTNCWVAVQTGHMIDAINIASNLWPIALVVWVWNGVLNKERKDVLSAVVGDSGSRPGMLETVINAMAGRNKPQ